MRLFLRRFFIWAVLVPAGVYLALALVFWVWGTIQLHLELKRWEALGVPTRLQDTRPPDVPPETNAAPLYESLRGKLQLNDAEKEALSKPWEIADPAAFIEPYKDILATLHEAAKRPNLVWERKYYDIDCASQLDCDSSNLAWKDIPIRQMSKLLVLQARAKANQGDSASAFTAVQTALSISRHTRIYDSFISNLLSMSIEFISLEAIQELLASGSLVPDAELDAMIPDTDWLKTWRHSLKLIGVFEIAGYKQGYPYAHCYENEAGQVLCTQIPRPYNLPLMKGIRKIALLYNLKALILADEKAEDLTFSNYYPSFDLDGWGYYKHIYNTIFQFEVYEFLKARYNWLKLSLQESALRSAIEIMQYKNANGSYPETWEMPIDPYSNTPLNYKQLDEGGFMVSRTTASQEVYNWEWRFP